MSARLSAGFYAIVGLSLGALLTSSTVASEDDLALPLNVRIDQIIAAGHVGEDAPIADDLTFLNRAYLDLTGVPPSSRIAREFLVDRSPAKRALLIERLLASPEYSQNMANVFDVMWMERRTDDKNVPLAEWRAYLLESFRNNKPYDQLAREVLGADGADPKLRGAARFVLYRDVEPNSLVRDVGRLFFGMDLTCAQCHDHPSIDGFKQAEYFGIYAFFNRSYLFTDKEKKVFVAEKADGDVNFTSVFTKESDKSGPRLPGDLEVPEPDIKSGEEYAVAPADNVRPVPKYSRRARLAELVGSGKNQQFNRNIANRLWAHMMGRGLVEPLEMHHVDNPAAHGLLLNVLADSLVGMKYDVRAFMRELALSKAYQQAILIPADIAAHAGLSEQLIGTLEAQEQQKKTLAEGTQEALKKSLEVVKQTLAATSPVFEELTKAKNAQAEAQKAADAAAKALADAQKVEEAKKIAAAAITDVAQKVVDAVSKLPEEKELAAAAEKFKARATTISSELAAASKKVADLSPAVKSTSDALNEARQTTSNASEKGRVASQQLYTAKAAAREAELQSAREFSVAKQIFGMRVHLQSMKEHLAKVKDFERARIDVAKLKEQTSPLQVAIVRAESEVTKLKTELMAAQLGNESAAKLLSTTRQQLEAKQSTTKTVAEVAAAAEAAVQKVAGDEELKQASQAVKSRLEKLNAESAELQKEIETKEQAAKGTAERLSTVQLSLSNAQAELDRVSQPIAELRPKLDEATAKLESSELAVKASLEAIERFWTERFHSGRLRHKSPEQMATSVMQATGALDKVRQDAEAEINKTTPLDSTAGDPAKVSARNLAIEQKFAEKLKPNLDTFVRLFGHGAGQRQGEFFATADQALFFANGGVLTGWLAPSGSNLTARCGQLEDPRAIAEELYLSVMVRLPSEEEIADIVKLFADRPMEKPNVIQEVAWGLITSAEFRFIQ